ncbi:bifunctional diguanylate cyclase/phosphodiesterase [Marinimicrobium alkaliphilum]|uniref:bifunctional diguanylate cyclase/phosphodiesterase n=1 Tax=Marinimicrobium alkaliphilum TaxID=2202654 RepID=UPI000DB9BC95|nr:bifunctional diguanylate cyclase/phosphodiesterase [Marinimicrobium alkaliphilum]
MALHPDSYALQQLIDGRQLTPLFQPIIDWEAQRILGYEALIRGPADSPLHTPDQLFAAARSGHQLAALEFACRAVSCEQFAALGLPGKLFLNMSPLSFTDTEYRDGVTREILQRVGLSAERIVFELTERQPLDDSVLLTRATAHFRSQGFAVALDDLGAGYSGLRVWSELYPDYVKIDRHFISNIDLDPVKREFVRAMLAIAHRTGNKVIAEGIETKAELQTLITMGVDYFQGFYLGRPQATPPKTLPEHLAALPVLTPRRQDVFSRCLRDITRHLQPLAPKEATGQVVQRFLDDPGLASLPVVDGTRPVGMVNRGELLEMYSRQYARDLHATKPIAGFVSKRALILEAESELKSVGQRLTEEPGQNLNTDILVCERGQYFGVARVQSLLRAITEEKLTAARHSNPLTQLPGNVPLYEWVDHLLSERRPFTAAYCDINHFKPFNDAFGYSYGDDIIIRLSQSLSRHLDHECDFLGHVGGDDFILIFQSADWYTRCEAILADFPNLLNKVLSPDQQAYWSKDRAGRRKRYGPLTLAIGCVHPDLDACRTHHQLSLLLAEAKASAKQQSGSHLFVSRRRSVE